MYKLLNSIMCHVEYNIPWTKVHYHLCVPSLLKRQRNMQYIFYLLSQILNCSSMNLFYIGIGESNIRYYLKHDT